MANEYAVHAADLAAVADAIREKGGTEEPLAFPDGFVSAVGAIEAGGQYTLEDIADKTAISGDIVVQGTKIGAYAFYGANIASVSAPNASSVGTYAFAYCKKLESADIPLVTSFYTCDFAFAYCSALKHVNLPACEVLGMKQFVTCTALESVSLPAVKQVYANAFEGCTALETVEFTKPVSFFRPSVFNNCQKLGALILRGATLSGLSYNNLFTNTPLTGYGGTYSGHIYVPAALMETYQTATNWSALYAAYPDIFQPIEGSEYE